MVKSNEWIKIQSALEEEGKEEKEYQSKFFIFVFDLDWI